MTNRSPVACFVEAFLEKVDPLLIPGVKPEMQWLSRLAMFKTERRAEFESFCSDALENLLGRTADWDDGRVQLADEILRKSGCLTLSDLRGRHQKALVRILKKGTIKNEKDYMLAKSAVDDSLGMSDSMRAELERILIAYENNR